ncbi:hypothetical protein VY88_16770 [Azospirillum thiophilum]|uniref:Uncharacterized protein n=1 Tax=Azospirillum thiophilum TaxID=528244 RepID=A0AAC8ZUQ6_9PROT|nr:hypothetical protein [Azospirillum thiophilum]ALG72667.1 hypothetical protein AL072_16740 [Azospirillum thiophilum]KJR64415.1 hypothetical protein VY88_16770 [Azospirillum thiophilum]
MPPDCLMSAESFPHWAAEPPVPPDGALVPNSRFHGEQWIMAAGMLARGASFQQVARSMGCSRTTLWRAYYGSQPFRHRVWWERQSLNREAELRLHSLRGMVTEQIERLVSAGDPATLRWLADRLGLFSGDDRPQAAKPAAAAPAVPAADIDRETTMDAAIELAMDAAMDADDRVPGALRERTPPDPRAVAAILARPEAEGPKGVYPWTLNPDDRYPNLGSAAERRGGRGA